MTQRRGIPAGARSPIRALAAVAVCAAAVAAFGPGRAAAAQNPIQAENALPGTTAWQPLNATTGNAPHSIEGYTSEVSVAPGDVVHFHVSTSPAARYRVEIYRLGWYGGAGGRLLGCLPACGSDEQGAAQPIPAPDPTTGYDAAGWPVTDTFTIPSTAVSGYYEAKLVLTSGSLAGNSAPIPFVVRAPSTYHAAILVQASVNTWQAYNPWGGKSLYDFNSTNDVAANHISFDRPYDPSQTPLFYEYALARFLERSGLDVSYTTDVDTDQNPAELTAHRLVVSAGHDEYWSKTIRDAFEGARAAGINLAFIGADIADWQIRYEDNWRTIVEYRDGTVGYPGGDPTTDPSVETTRFRQLVPPRPQCTLLGIQYQDANNGGGPPFDYTVPGAALSNSWFANTGFQAGAQLVGSVGYEWDGIQAGCSTPGPETVLFHYEGSPNADAITYTDPSSGARVFSSGSLDFIYALDNYFGGSTAMDPRAQQFALNMLSDLGGGSGQPPQNVSLPTVAGAAQQGQTLTATTGSWSGTPSSYAYQWQQCDSGGGSCTAIAGATASTYTLQASDVNHTVRVQVTATNGAGSSQPAASAATGVVIPVSDGTTLGTTVVGPLSAAAGPNWLDSSGPYALSAAATATKLSGYVAGDPSQPFGLRGVVYADDGSGTKPGAFVAVTTEVTVPAGQAAQWVDLPFAAPASLPAGRYWIGYWYSNGLGTYYYTDVAGSEQFVRATYSSTGNPPASYGSSFGATSEYALYATLAPAGPPVNTVVPVVSGSAVQGQVLSVSNGSWTGSPTGFAYQWQDCDSGGAGCANVGGATGQTYTLQAADVGHTVRALVTASNAAGPSTPAASGVTAVVGAPPTNTSPPVVSGSAVQGQVLSTSNGSWTGSPTGFAYQWQDCDSTGAGCTNIGAASSQTYTLQAADVGHTVRALVTASNAAGASTPAASNLSAVVTAPAAPPTNTTAPVLSGSAVQGQVLSTSNGSWTGSPTGFAYQWQDCDTNGANCTNIGAASSQTYTLQAADVGHTVRALVTASNAAGPSTPAASNASAVVAAVTSGSFGQTQIGTLIDNGGANYLDASGPYTINTGVTVSSLSAYIAGGSTNSRLRGAIYADNNGNPGSLVAVTPQTTITASRAAAWTTLTFTNPVTLPTGSYWLAYWYADSNSHHYYLDRANAERFTPTTYSATNNPPTSFGSSFTATSSYSLYAKYTIP
jgi:hypothetical protein